MTPATQPKPKPKGQRPRCLHCEKELLPQFRDELPGYALPGPLLNPAKLDQWKKENPGWHKWTGNYGRYNDNRFCGLNCGYNYAVAHTRPAK